MSDLTTRVALKDIFQTGDPLNELAFIHLIDTLALTSEAPTGLARILHSSSPGATLPTTSNFIGELFVKNGATKKGTYTSLDLVGNWAGPLE